MNGLHRAAAMVRAMGHASGQHTFTLPELLGIAQAIDAEADNEDTPPMGTVMCQACGHPRPAP